MKDLLADIYLARRLTAALLHLSDESELIPVGVAQWLTIPNNSL
jgi:hypothetical protein